MSTGRGSKHTSFTEEEVREILRKGTPSDLIKDKRILVLTPDTTRTAPLPMMVRALHSVFAPSVSKLDFMVALGTHRLLSRNEIRKLYGIKEDERKTRYCDSSFFNHRWDLPETFKTIGKIGAGEIEKLTDGVFREEIDVVINRKIYDYDLIVILGPVFPHEVAGFSGGNKYLFPGISGGDFMHFFHWLGAVVTCWNVIGKKNTPIRTLLNRAAGFVGVKRHCIAMVVTPENRLAGLFVGSPEEAWSDAADLSAELHIVYKKRPFHLVLGKAPSMYDELWTAGKVMYKLEPVVADGGKLVIYGKHIGVISHTWGHYIERTGYHVRDYFLSRMEMFKNIPRGVLAHLTHVKGLGTFVSGDECPRIEVVLATSITEELCRKINLGYMDPETVDIEDYCNREGEGVLFVQDAGEILHRLEDE